MRSSILALRTPEHSYIHELYNAEIAAIKIRISIYLCRFLKFSISLLSTQRNLTYA